MMRAALLILLAPLAGLSSAQARNVITNHRTSGGSSCTGGYQGVGDVKTGASFYYGLRAYSCAYAGPGNNPSDRHSPGER